MTRCDEIQVLLALRPEDRSVTEERRVRAHLAVCAECTARAEAYAEQDRAIRSEPRLALTPSQRGQLLSTIERKRRRHEMRSKLFTSAGTAVAITALIGLALCSRLMRPFRTRLIPGAPVGAPTEEVPTDDLHEVAFEFDMERCVHDPGEWDPSLDLAITIDRVMVSSTDWKVGERWLVEGSYALEAGSVQIAFLPDYEGTSRYDVSGDSTLSPGTGNFSLSYELLAITGTVRSEDLKLGVYDRESGGTLRCPIDLKETVSSQEGQFQWPTARFEISGWTFNDPRNPDHPGIDIAAAEGETVFSIADGKVTFAGPKGDYGNLVVVDHRDGWSSAYAQLRDIEVDVGHAVRQGDPLGRAGSTGDSSGPHLHFELRYNGDPVNPLHHTLAFGEPFAKSDPLIFAGEIRSETRTVDPVAGPQGPPLALGEKDPEDPLAPARLETPAEVHLFLRWKVISAPSADWRVFAHLVREETGDLALQTDASVDWPDQPCSDEERGDACAVSTEHAFTFPSGFPSGLYRIEIGLYDPESGKRAPVTSPVEAAGWTNAVLSRVRIVSEDDGFASGDVERELARMFVDDPDGECGWEVLGEDDMQSYVWAICQSPGGTAVSAPAVLYWEAGKETVAKIQMPRDGSLYGEDVRLLFPPAVQERILDHDVDMDAIWRQIERDLTAVTGTVVDNAASAEVVTLEDDDGKQWHVLWRAGDAVRRSDGSRAEFRDLGRGMTVEVVGFPRPEATTPNVLAPARVTILSEPEDLAASLKDLLLRREELPGIPLDDAGADDWEPTALPVPGVQYEEDLVGNLARQDGCVAAYKVGGPRVPEEEADSSAVVYVMNAIYEFETANQASREYKALLARMAREAPAPTETRYDGTTQGGMEAKAVEFVASEGDAVYWLFGVKEQHLHLLVVNGLDDDATRAFFEATMAQVLTRGTD
jgi:murein DD-endopeptidase MepM/ murein hydrolase activator NlpD